MVVNSENNLSAYADAGNLLAAALQQLSEINKALAASRNPDLQSASERARDTISQIRSAMRSGTLDASSIASLSAALNIGVDPSALAVEAAQEGGTVAVRVQLAAASLESHRAVERMTGDLFDRHEFDADVARHTHGAELEAFKRREAEDEKYIREQSARHTPEGDLNASGKMQGYMLDANAHGAGDNPDFLKKWNDLREKTDRLRDSMRAAGKSTAEYNKNLREDVVTDRIGLSDGSQRSTSASVSKADAAKEQSLAVDTDSMNAKLAAAGLAGPESSELGGHGLSVQKPGRASDAIAR